MAAAARQLRAAREAERASHVEALLSARFAQNSAPLRTLSSQRFLASVMSDCQAQV